MSRVAEPSPADRSFALGVTLPDRGLMVADESGVQLYMLDGNRLGKWNDLRAVVDPLIHRPGARVLSRGKQRFVLTGGTDRLTPFREDVPLAHGYALRLGGERDRFGLVHAGVVRARIPRGDLRFMVSYRRDVLSFLADGEPRLMDLRVGIRQSDGLDGCHLADRGFFICDRYSGGVTPPAADGVARVRTRESSTDLAPLPHQIGHWDHLAVSPDGRRLVLQHSGECEIPSVYTVLADGGAPKPLHRGGEAWHIGWSSDGRALVVFTEGICGEGAESPGVYVVGDKIELVMKIAEPSSKTIGMWAPDSSRSGGTATLRASRSSTITRSG